MEKIYGTRITSVFAKKLEGGGNDFFLCYYALFSIFWRNLILIASNMRVTVKNDIEFVLER